MSQGNKTHQIMTELPKIIDAALCAVNHNQCQHQMLYNVKLLHSERRVGVSTNANRALISGGLRASVRSHDRKIHENV